MKQGVQFLVFSAMIGAAASCGAKEDNKQQQAPPPVSVNIDTVQQAPALYYDEYPATINALNQVDIHAQVSGYITGIYFQDGQRVTKGQRLYSIDQQKYAGDYNQAIANLNVSKANLAKAQKNADRYLELDKNDAIAKQTVDNALADLDAAKMSVEAAKASAAAVETNLRYANIYAPFSGVIGISQVKLGSAVTPGTTILNTISAEGSLAVDFAVDEKEIPRFVKMQQQGGAIGDSVFTIALPDGSVYAYPGKIALLDRAVDPQTGTIRARLEFPNPQSILKPGMTCNVRVKSYNNDAILIPTKAITEQMGEYFVYVLGDSNKAVQTKITAGMRINDKTVVKDGLTAGEKIITDGVQKVRSGAVVKPASDAAVQDSVPKQAH
ncbi:efflux RND transporter periplasmic adaptor subunit [Parafilimonas sp.]|uniref:efflux RND transporter periplasmic adaptor subunit n=1 Tax=Parafilimonas sp. TaxID=1969739 RepID=UPI0039E53DED